MAEVDCALPLFNTSVILPVTPIEEGSPPSDGEAEVFFTVTYTCDGVSLTSPPLATLQEALEWASVELGYAGTWTVSGNELILTDSPCDAVLDINPRASSELIGIPMIPGCTDPNADNYVLTDPPVNWNDGSCTYPADPSPNYIDIICAKYTITSDIQYSETSGLTMDSYVESCNTNNNRPVIFVLHPGGSSKTEFSTVKFCKDFASRGYKAYAVDFGESGGGGGFDAAKQKAAIINMCCAARWVRANAVSEGINPLNIFGIGISAGALTITQWNVCSIALDAGNPYFASPINAENSSQSSIPTGTASQAGAISPQIEQFIDVNMSPHKFYNGTKDCTIAYSFNQCGVMGALEDYNHLLSLGIDVTFTPFFNDDHSIGNHHDEILLGSNLQVDGAAKAVYGDNSFTTDVGVVAKFASLLSP